MLLTQKPRIKTTFQLKGSMYALTTLKLLHYDPVLFSKQIKEKVKSSPKFFENAPVMLDFSSTDNLEAVNLAELTASMRELGMIIVGIRTSDQNLKEQAIKIRIAIFNQTQPAPCEKTTQETHSNHTKIIHQPVRSGQQIYAKDSDLVVLGTVSPGAEILADGHIHVYGALRGRALAGVKGNIDSYIFCQQFDAELIAIAGRYMISEDLQEHKPAPCIKVYLVDDRIQIDPIL